MRISVNFLAWAFFLLSLPQYPTHQKKSLRIVEASRQKNVLEKLIADKDKVIQTSSANLIMN